MTGSDFYAYILRVFKRTDKETDVYEAITDTIMEIKARFISDDFKTIVSNLVISALGNYTIDLPTDFGHIIGDVIILENGQGSYPLHKRTKETFDRLYPHPADTTIVRSKPTDFCLFGGKIYLGPVPDSVANYAYKLSYTTEAETAVTSATAAVPFTDRFRWIIRDMVLEKLYAGLGFDAEAQKFKVRGEEGLSLMVGNDVFNTDTIEAVDYQGV